uniref:Caveolin n=1 Tax=Lotharella oceanica TaxID=641309 RepID=A0A7S2XD91_9EUKA
MLTQPLPERDTKDTVVEIHAANEATNDPKLNDDLLGGDDDDPDCLPFCYTKGPIGCIFMLFFMILGIFCWAFGFAFKAIVCVVTCPCPGSTICNCCANLAAWMISLPAKVWKMHCRLLSVLMRTMQAPLSAPYSSAECCKQIGCMPCAHIHVQPY